MPLARSKSIPSFFFKSFLLQPTDISPLPQPYFHCIESGQSPAHSRNKSLIDNSSPSGIFFVPEMIQINHMKGTTGQSRFHRINLITGWSVGPPRPPAAPSPPTPRQPSASWQYPS
jgi:hypothetical protein